MADTMLSEPERLPSFGRALPVNASEIARFRCFDAEGKCVGHSTVNRVPLKSGKRIYDGFIIRWVMGNSGEWEQTTLVGPKAVKTAASKMGWSL